MYIVAPRFSFLTGDYCDGDNHAEYRRMSVDGVLFVLVSRFSFLTGGYCGGNNHAEYR